MPRTAEHLGRYRGRRIDDTYPQAVRTMRIALRWVGQPVPTWQEIVAAFPMSRAAAYRYRQNLRDARGEV